MNRRRDCFCLVSLVALAGVAGVANAELPPLPDPQPYAAAGKEVRVVPKLMRGTFPWTLNAYTPDEKTVTLACGTFVCGNKEVSVRRRGAQNDGGFTGLDISVDGQQAARIQMSPNGKVVPVENDVVVDEQAGTIRVTMLKGRFWYEVRADGENRLKVTWRDDSGGTAIYFFPANGAGPDGERTANAAVTVSLEGKPFRCRGFGQMKRHGAYVIDLGTVRELVHKDVPPPVGGIDFWKNDGFHYAKSPTRNLLRNPSFEQGLLYWGRANCGGDYRPDEPQEHYAVEKGGRFGERCLHILTTQCGANPLRSFPVPLTSGKRYTLSMWVKYLATTLPADRRADAKTKVWFAIGNARENGPIKGHWANGDLNTNPDARPTVAYKDGWTRVTRTFTGDDAGLIVYLRTPDCLYDGLQLEEGETATDFVAPPLEARLVTPDRDNMLRFGEKADCAIAFVGQATGSVQVQVSDIYGETLLDRQEKLVPTATGVARIPLFTDTAWPRTGIFRIRLDYTLDLQLPTLNSKLSYTQYLRFVVIDPLCGKHPTARLFACHYDPGRADRGIDFMEKAVACGWGGTENVGPTEIRENKGRFQLLKRYGVVSMMSSLIREVRAYCFPKADDKTYLTEFRQRAKPFTPELLAKIEQGAYEAVKGISETNLPCVALQGEEESSALVNGATDGGREYGRAQFAFYKGVKRANPKIEVAPTQGTSGWSKMRGRKAYEQYLAAANANGFKYDAVAVHPYGNIDCGTLSYEDADAEIAYLQELLAKHGYDPKKTPIYLSECYNVPDTLIPEWGCDLNGDQYRWGKIGYDFGNRDFQSACQIARMYLIYLKYWPQVRGCHCWRGPFIDMALSPASYSLAINTIGRFLPDPVFVGEARPAAGVRAYVWNQSGEGVAAIWAIDQQAELGRRKCPKLSVAFAQKVRFFDMLGNERSPAGGPIQLTSAPLYLKAKDAQALLKDLQDAFSTDAASCVKPVFAPDAEGTVFARLKNMTSRAQQGVLTVNGKTHPYDIAPNGEQAIRVDAMAPEADRTSVASYAWKIAPKDGSASSGVWDQAAFFVTRRAAGGPDWTKVPALPLANWRVRRPKDEADLSGTCQVCWDDAALYLKVRVKDATLVDRKARTLKTFAQNLYNADGALELYVDCGANGRANGDRQYDLDDYRYDFAPPAGNRSGRGLVWRLVEVDHQLADGMEMPSKEECQERIGCDFTRTADGYEYVLTLKNRYLEPILLQKGASFGLGLYVHDFEDVEGSKGYHGLSNLAEEGAEAQKNPAAWPLVILK